MSTSKGIKRKRDLINRTRLPQVGSSLSLGLGRSPSSSDSNSSSATACATMSSDKETDEVSSMDIELDFSLRLGGEKLPSSKETTCSNLKTLEMLPMIDLELSLSTVPSESRITSVHQGSSPLQLGKEMRQSVGGSQNADEGSTSSRWKPGIIIPPLQAPMKTGPIVIFNQLPKKIDPTLIVPDLSPSVLTTPKSPVTCTSGITQQQQQPQHRGSRSKTCLIEGCGKGARGASGRCIRHGGGKRCRRENCSNSAEGLLGLCISHGGGRRCQLLGCIHGAQGSTMFCKAHGGGKRCTAPGCPRGAEGSTFCKRHGGGKRCAFKGGLCPKSVHGGTNFCVAHGGGKRCAVPECKISARGRTDHCVRHGGGKRCNFEGCGRSAQGSTDFCQGHGGGKKCSWGHPGSDHRSQSRGPCNSFARGKTGLYSLHGGLVRDKRVHGGVTLGLMVQDPKLIQLEKEVITEDMNVDVWKIGTGTGTFADSKNSDLNQYGVPTAQISEGRVRGGSLIANLTSGSGLGSRIGKGVVANPSEPMESYIMPHGWM